MLIMYKSLNHGVIESKLSQVTVTLKVEIIHRPLNS